MATSDTNENGKSPTRPAGMDMSQIIQLLSTQPSNFTSNSSIREITFNLTEDWEIRKRRNAERRMRLEFTDEQRREHFAQKQKEYDAEIDDTLTELHEWRSEIEMWEERTPDIHDYALKRKEIYEALAALSPRLNGDSLMRGGADDTARCGQLLILMEKKWTDTDKEEQAVCLMSALQWLIRQEAAAHPETSETIDKAEETEEGTPPTVIPPKDEDKEITALRKLLVEKLHIPTNGENSAITFGDKSYSQGQVLAAVMWIYKNKGIEWAKTTSQFAGKAAPVLNRSKESIEKKINRALKPVKGIPLNKLSKNEILKKTNNRALTGQIHNEWDGLYPIVLQLSESVPGR